MPDMSIIDELIIRYLHENISEDEKIALNKWIDESFDNKLLFEKLTDSKHISGELDKFYQYNDLKGWVQVKESYSFTHKTANSPEQGKLFSMVTWQRVAVAASVLLIISAGIFYYNNSKSRERNPVAEVKLPADMMPPQLNRATITLANGQLIYLSNTNNGKIAQQGNVNVRKLGDGQIVYDDLRQDEGSMMYNTLTNPRGSKVIDMILSDGTRVWVNAGSSVTYPVAFVGNQRKVSITGEVYFEVAHNAKMPFHALVNNVDVRVLGTRFNINAYADENMIKTTLLEGSVRINKGNSNALIAPGEQAEVDNLSDEIIVKNNLDLEEVMAWKNGKFYFNNTDIKTIMKEIERWYDVNVEYDGNVSKLFGGTISRNVSASNVFKILEATGGVHFYIEGKKVIVKP